MSTNFRKVLLQIDSQLRAEDLYSLKFLCLPFIRRRPVSQVESGHDLFNILESQYLISCSDCSFLYQLLGKIGRQDLCNFLHERKSVIQVDSSPECLDRDDFKFYAVLFDISEELCHDDVKRLRYLYEALPGGKEMRYGIDVFTALTDRGLLGPTILETLIENLDDIGRKDLASKLQDFKKQYQTAEFCKSQGYGHIGQEKSPLPCDETLPKQAEDSRDDLVEGVHSLRVSEGAQGGGGVFHKEGRMFEACQPSLGEAASMMSGTCMGTGFEDSTVYLSLPHTPQMAPAGNTGLPRYKMDANPRGTCLVIDNKEFTYNPRDRNAKQLKRRGGSEKDRENIERCFRDLNFDVKIVEDKSDSEMLSLLQEYALNDQANNRANCFVVFILSHGGSDYNGVFMYGRNGLKVYQNDITCLFRPDVCPSLRGKPKLFFFVCCLGGTYSKVVPSSDHLSEVESVNTDSAADDESLRSLICNDQDFLIGYSTVKGNVSFRDTLEGTWYITALTQVLSDYHARANLQDMLVLVNDKVARNSVHCRNEQGVSGEYTQVPAPQHTLTKQVWF